LKNTNVGKDWKVIHTKHNEQINQISKRLSAILIKRSHFQLGVNFFLKIFWEFKTLRNKEIWFKRVESFSNPITLTNSLEKIPI
jgi:hypothetical protein